METTLIVTITALISILGITALVLISKILVDAYHLIGLLSDKKEQHECQCNKSRVE